LAARIIEAKGASLTAVKTFLSDYKILKRGITKETGLVRSIISLGVITIATFIIL